MKSNLLLLLLLVMLPLLFQSCGDRAGIDHNAPSQLTLYHGETYQIKASSDHRISYSSENDFIAYVTQAGIIEAGTIGETTIIMDNEKTTETIKVTVPAKYNTFPDPLCKRGMTKNEVISQLGNDYQVWYGENTVVYVNISVANGSRANYIYYFDNKDIFDHTTLQIFNDPGSSITGVTEHVAERYKLFGESVLDSGALFKIYGDAFTWNSRSIEVRVVDYTSTSAFEFPYVLIHYIP